MECYRHPGVEMQFTCRGCRRPICDECGEVVAGHVLCVVCVEEAEGRLSGETEASAEAPPAEAPEGKPPGFFRRVGRGLGWGLICGQWWTVWVLASGILFGSVRLDGEFLPLLVGVMVLFGAAGLLTGGLIGLTNARDRWGAAMGIGMGILLCFLEVQLAEDNRAYFNLLFYVISGMYVGNSLTYRIQYPVLKSEV